MEPRFDLRLNDILTISSFSKNRRNDFLRFIRPIFLNSTINTVFNLENNAFSVKLRGQCDCWNGEIPLKKSSNEFSVILPLRTGFFRYKFSLHHINKCILKKDRQIVSPKNFNYCKNIKRLDKEIISSDSLLDNETKTSSNFQFSYKIGSDNSNRVPRKIPLQLLNALHLEVFSVRNLFNLPESFFYTDVSQTVLTNHMLFLKNLDKNVNRIREFFSVKIKFRNKTCIFLYLEPRDHCCKKNFHPIKTFF